MPRLGQERGRVHQPLGEDQAGSRWGCGLPHALGSGVQVLPRIWAHAFVLQEAGEGQPDESKAGSRARACQAH